MTSWTCCDCCGSRDDVVAVEVDALGVPGAGVPAWLCARCRRGCPDCAALFA